MTDVVAAGVVLLGALLLAAVLYYYQKSRELEQKLLAAALKPVKVSNQARAVIKGQIAEQLAPLLPGFPFTPSDYRAVGGEPIDFIAFKGLTLAKEGLGDITEIVIGDIKMGSSHLSPHQQMIKEAVEQGRVRWETIHIDQDFQVVKPRRRAR